MSLNPIQSSGSNPMTGVESSTATFSQGISHGHTAVQGMFNNGMTAVLSNNNPQKMATLGQVVGAGLLILGILACFTGAGSSVGVPLMIAGGIILGISMATSFSTNLLEEVQKQNPQDPQWGRTLLIALLKTLSTGLANSLAGGMTAAPMALGPSGAAVASLGLGRQAVRRPQVAGMQEPYEDPRLHLRPLPHLGRHEMLFGGEETGETLHGISAQKSKKQRQVARLPEIPEDLKRGWPTNAAALPVFQRLARTMDSEHE